MQSQEPTGPSRLNPNFGVHPVTKGTKDLSKMVSLEEAGLITGESRGGGAFLTQRMGALSLLEGDLTSWRCPEEGGTHKGTGQRCRFQKGLRENRMPEDSLSKQKVTAVPTVILLVSSFLGLSMYPFAHPPICSPVLTSSHQWQSGKSCAMCRERCSE